MAVCDFQQNCKTENTPLFLSMRHAILEIIMPQLCPSMKKFLAPPLCESVRGSVPLSYKMVAVVRYFNEKQTNRCYNKTSKNVNQQN